MSDHDWATEQIAAYVMGGSTAEETARLELHTRDCPGCAAALSATRRVDRNLDSLFGGIRPGLALEDDAIQSIRAARRNVFKFSTRLPRMGIAAGILLVLSIVGAMAGALVSDGRLPLPGLARSGSAGVPSEASVVIVKSSAKEEVRETEEGLEAGRQPTHEIERLRRATGPITAADSFVRDSTSSSARGQAPKSEINGTLATGLGARLGNNPVFAGGTPGASLGTTTFDLGSGGRPAGGGYGGVALGSMKSTSPASGQGGRPAQSEGQGARVLSTLNYFGATSPEAADFSRLASSFRPNDYRPAMAEQNKSVPEKDGRELARQDFKVPAGSEPESAAHRVVIRTGEMEFEVASFDAAVAAVTKLVAGVKGAFVATVNSDKLANGKVRGSITVRAPPEHLDGLVLDLRRDLGPMGGLKGMKIGSQDITKQYTDLESRLRAARAMEQRLLQMIKDGKGEIKQLLEAERELGNWRTKIEEFEGELRYYGNLVALATLTITLSEKEIRSAVAVTENERVQAGVEVEDVDKAYRETVAAVAETKGRMIKSELKQVADGQFNAMMQFEVPPETSGPMRDRLKQLGRIARLDIDRSQHSEGGTAPSDVKVKRGDTVFLLQIYNLINVAARETNVLQIAVPNVRAGYQALREVAGKAGARVLVAQLNEQDARNVTAQIDVDVRRPEDAAYRAALDAAGEIASRQVGRAAEGNNVTDSKVQYRVTLLGTDKLSPRETTSMTLEVQDVDQALATLGAQVSEVKGRQLSAQSTRDRAGKVTAQVSYEVPLAAASLADRFKAVGTVRGYQSIRDQQAPAGKYATARIDVTLVSGDQIVSADDGLWPQVRRGLSYSMAVLLTSITWVVFGLCVVLPWALIGFVVYRLFRRPSRSLAPPTQVT
jgi:hypothetical protein